MLETAPHWNKVGMRPHHGIALPLFSLHSAKSCGIGEYFDLLPLIDWCASVGLDLIQLLPINDTGDDTSPYNALSSCALDPIYLSLHDLPDVGPLLKDLEPLKALTQTPCVVRQEVLYQKMKWLTRYFLRHFSEVVLQPSYQQFLAEHPWVRPYALFKTYKEEYGRKYWREWPLEAQSPNFHAMEEKRETIHFYSFLQYLCHQQMSAVHAHAVKQRILLKGDIPILISPDSVDVWADPHLFDARLAAGAPPDRFTPLGQRWGFPLFRWNAMEAEKYAWWKRRLQLAGQYYDLYRIDHVVGFFRIWGIPEGKSASQGHFIPQDSSLWEGQGRKLLEMMIRSSPLLPIAEDLGTIPPMVRPLLKELGICSTKLIRWERRWESDKSFIPYDQYEPFSLTTLSTADTETTLQWWRESPEAARVFAQFKGWNYRSELSQEELESILYDSHHTASFFHINLLQESLALFPELVSSRLEEERINVPGTLSPNNWSYRYRPSVETLVSHAPLQKVFQRITKKSP